MVSHIQHVLSFSASTYISVWNWAVQISPKGAVGIQNPHLDRASSDNVRNLFEIPCMYMTACLTACPSSGRYNSDISIKTSFYYTESYKFAGWAFLLVIRVDTNTIDGQDGCCEVAESHHV